MTIALTSDALAQSKLNRFFPLLGKEKTWAYGLLNLFARQEEKLILGSFHLTHKMNFSVQQEPNHLRHKQILE